MPRQKRTTRSLAHLERELHVLNAQRRSLLAEMTAAVERLGIDAMTEVAKIGQATGLGAELPTGSGTSSAGRKPRPNTMNSPASGKRSPAAKRR